MSTGQLQEAIAQFEEALSLQPEDAQTHVNLANALTRAKRLPEAIAQYQEALRLEPDLAGGHLPETIAQLQEELRLPPPQGNSGAVEGRPHSRRKGGSAANEHSLSDVAHDARAAASDRQDPDHGIH